MDVDHLQGREFFDHAAWSEARRKRVETSPQRDVEAVGEECDEYVRLDALLELVKDRADGEVSFEDLEDLFDRDERDLTMMHSCASMAKLTVDDFRIAAVP